MMADPPKPAGAEAGATYQVGSIEVPTEPRRQKGAVITQMDFDLLHEGPPALKFSSRRDVCIGIAATSLVGVIGLLATGEYFTPGASPVPRWWAWIFTSLLIAATLAASVIAYFAHRDSTAQDGQAYGECVKNIETQLKGVEAPRDP